MFCIKLYCNNGPFLQYINILQGNVHNIIYCCHISVYCRSLYIIVYNNSAPKHG